MTTERYTRESVTIHSVTIPQGEMTLGVIGSANRDEAMFEKPDELDLTREPNKHLFVWTGNTLLSGCAARADGSADRYQHFVKGHTELATEDFTKPLAVAAQHDAARVSFVTR